MKEQLGNKPDFKGKQGATRAIDLGLASNTNFEVQIGKRPILLDAVRTLIDRRTANIADPVDRAIARYMVEYANGEELDRMFEEEGMRNTFGNSGEILSDRCNYTYWTPIMDQSVFTQLTDIDPQLVPRLQSVVDVGAGSGDLIRTLIGWGISPERIIGVDISPTSACRVQELGSWSRQGRFDKVADSSERFDLIFLSYFIDRDADQLATFKRAIETLELEGTLVLEGLFPCESVDPNGLIYADPLSTVTKGASTEEDISLIIESWRKISQDLGVKISITTIASGQRQVYSRDGVELLPSDIIVARRIS